MSAGEQRLALAWCRSVRLGPRPRQKMKPLHRSELISQERHTKGMSELTTAACPGHHSCLRYMMVCRMIDAAFPTNVTRTPRVNILKINLALGLKSLTLAASLI